MFESYSVSSGAGLDTHSLPWVERGLQPHGPQLPVRENAQVRMLHEHGAEQSMGMNRSSVGRDPIGTKH